MRSETIAFEVVDRMMLLVHSLQKPSEEDWDKYLSYVIEHKEDIDHILVMAKGPGPDPLQRERLVESYLKTFQGSTAIVTTSKMLRGIVTLLGWFNRRVKPFKTIEQAFAYLQIPSAQAQKIQQKIAEFEHGWA